MLYPYYDHDTRMVYVAGKGDGNVRYYEVTRDDDRAFYLSQVKWEKMIYKNILKFEFNAEQLFGKANEVRHGPLESQKSVTENIMQAPRNLNFFSF